MPAARFRIGLGFIPSEAAFDYFVFATAGAAACGDQVIPIAAGESVGYGASYIAPRPRQIITVGFGYADGYLRSFSNVGQAIIRAKDGSVFPLPVVGRVSMDVTTLDVSDLPASVVSEANEVIFYAPEQGGIIAAAHSAGTIPYELLTSLKPTLARWVGVEGRGEGAKPI